MVEYVFHAQVDGPDLDSLESAACAQLWARELGKMAALIPNFRPNTPVPE